MRLSEAIALGRTLVHPIAGVTLTYDGLNGCALGMGYKAAGGEADCNPHQAGITLEEPAEMWPWLKKEMEMPCICMRSRLTAASIIAHLFDTHVMSQFPAPPPNWYWTLDQLIDWVRSVEPAEKEPKARSAKRYASLSIAGTRSKSPAAPHS